MWAIVGGGVGAWLWLAKRVLLPLRIARGEVREVRERETRLAWERHREGEGRGRENESRQQRKEQESKGESEREREPAAWARQ